jgi:hypothetical protein
LLLTTRLDSLLTQGIQDPLHTVLVSDLFKILMPLALRAGFCDVYLNTTFTFIMCAFVQKSFERK